jgi:uncharacterized protein YneF (UPF0154 family)
MMRVLFWILLLGNVIFFAMMQWSGLQVGDQQTVQVQPALHEEQIRLLNMQKGAAPAAEPVSAIPVHISAVSATVATEPSAPVCLEWGDFSGTDLARAMAALSALQLGEKLSQRQVEYNIGYWVYFPPLKDKAAANKKILQLKALGIAEYFVVPDAGPWLNAISLGVFKTQEAAQHFLDSLHAKGVRTAKVGERASKLKMTLFVLKGVDAAIEEKLGALQKDFAGSEIRKASCALTR